MFDANREQLIVDLASDWSEQMVQGREVSILEYLEKLPDEESRRAFTKLANASRLVAAAVAVQADPAIINTVSEAISNQGVAATDELECSRSVPTDHWARGI
jgi:hypothetical protein